MLTVSREDCDKQGNDQREARTGRENLFESPPCRKSDKKADDQSEDLPVKRIRRNQAGGRVEDRSQKWTKGHEGRDKLGRTEKFCDPGEGPVVPVETCEWDEQAVAKQRYE